MMSSLRARLIVGITLALAVLMVGSGVVVYALLRHAMVAEMDSSLIAATRLLMPLVEHDEDGVDLDLTQARQAAESGDNLVELWIGDGTVVRRSVALGNHDLQRLPASDDVPRVHGINLPSGEPGRAAQVSFDVMLEHDDAVTNQVERVTLVVARSTTRLMHQLAVIRTVLWTCVVGIVLFGGPIIVLVVGRALQPLNELGRQIEEIGHDSLHQRLSVNYLPTELMPVVTRLNDLLQRLDAAFQRERHFTGDVAHELRTPLAAMHAIVDVAGRQDRTNKEYVESLNDLRGVLHGTELMVEKLLALTRLDASQVTPQRHEVVMSEAVDAAWKTLATAAQERGLIFEVNMPSGLACHTDADLLQMVLINLLGNAVENTNPTGHIELSAELQDGGLVLTIENTGCELQPHDAEHVFDRFWRGDAARSNSGSHSGLGLSLVRRAIELLGGVVSAAVTPEHKFQIRVTLPT